MKVLITGFEPFGGDVINPSYEAVKMLEDNIDGAEVIKAAIPVVFKKSIIELEKLIELHQPDIVICVGQAGGRYDISIERVAINVDDARIPDNEGNKPIDEKIFEDGENAYFSNLPIKAMVEEIRRANIPASISNTAGTYVCNHIMYGLMYIINKKYPHIRGGFIHVPFLPEQVITRANTPYMNLDMISKALMLAIKAAINNKDDKKNSEGTIC
ncbi:MAG: pyroglutamyl-peptidase [Caloramator sp.]|jgi:pyroglutamyl-peptidase|uniref:Pyrrolidone-carboxylate peptidase n=1 Tax=Caloramator proteoclasticus DSM 10124 TaxID=1121262 RepID=A0A1M4XJR0_9CLOT|nr:MULTISPECIES: pyroglutamyl-peptidase I [Caloramator]MBZ4663657.1 pyroglutamyl-peptidase [Caloramator sp.]SHE93774.1 pyroglutamyl-peptidase [Caloramator proteoclasticus DSM 10124]